MNLPNVKIVESDLWIDLSNRFSSTTTTEVNNEEIQQKISWVKSLFPGTELTDYEEGYVETNKKKLREFFNTSRTLLAIINSSSKEERKLLDTYTFQKT